MTTDPWFYIGWILLVVAAGFVGWWVGAFLVALVAALSEVAAHYWRHLRTRHVEPKKGQSWRGLDGYHPINSVDADVIRVGSGFNARWLSRSDWAALVRAERLYLERDA